VGLKIILFVLIALNLTDNVLGSWLHEQLSNSAIALQVLYLKYLIIAILFIGFIIDLIYGLKIKRYEWFGVAYLVIAIIMSAAIMLLNSSNEGGSRLYLYFFPVMIYFAGMFIGRRSGFGVRFIVQAYAIGYLAMAGVFFALNMAVGAVALWRDYLNYAGFILDVKGFTDGAIEGLHGNFYYNIGPTQIPRFLGSFGDPLALAYAGMIIIIPAYYVFPKHRIFLCSLIGVVVAASFTRAIILVVPISIVIYQLFREKGFAASIVFSLVGLLLVLFAGDAIMSFSDNSSTNGHVSSISQIFDFLNLLTVFTGSVFSGKMPEFEPGLLNVLFLFGAIPFVLFISFMRGIYIRNVAIGSATPYISIIMLTGMLTLSIISSVFFATTSGWFAWFLAGFASKRSITMLSHDPVGANAAEIAASTQLDDGQRAFT
jgi:hypothetical protein